jgi:predicted dehydrogenase
MLAERTPAVGNSPPPTEVAFIGMGNVSSAYLRTLDELVSRGHACAGAMCARDKNSWPRLLARWPTLQLVATAEEVFDSEASVVVILTPPDSHADLARAAIARTKHVVVEKPWALSASEGRGVIKAARDAGVMVVAAPFVPLSPTFRSLSALVERGDIGTVHSARAMYGNLGSDWASWYHECLVGPLAEVGIYNLQSLTALLGPASGVQAASVVGIRERQIGGAWVGARGPDTVQVLLHHVTGAVSSVLASHAVAHYRRPAIELYGSEGTAYLQGDDWDPSGIDVWRTSRGCWESYDVIDRTWHWTDGLREAVMAIREGRAPLIDTEHDLHLLEVLDASAAAAETGRLVEVTSRFTPRRVKLDLSHVGLHLHDHTRSPADQ